MTTSLVIQSEKQAATIPPARTFAQENDSALVAAAKHGQSQAFDALVEKHEQRIYSVAVRITRSREDAEDIVQQTFASAFLHLREFAGKSSFSTWLTRIAINESLMLLRRGHRSREVSLMDWQANDDPAFAVKIPDPSPSPEESCLQRERERVLCSAIKELTLETRAAIQLRDLQERSTVETARIMGISVSALKGRVFRGRRKLRDALQRYAQRMPGLGSASRPQFPCEACG